MNPESPPKKEPRRTNGGAKLAKDHGIITDAHESATGYVVRVPLTAEQARQLVPLLHRAAERENTIFFSVIAPFWSLQDETVVWELQPTVIPARLWQKIKKLVLGSKSE